MTGRGQRPTLRTERLALRPFEIADAEEVQRWAGDRDIAAMTLTIPHPYEEGMAEEWIATHQERFERGELVNFAMTLRDEGPVIGAVGLSIAGQHERAELGYWIGKPWWGQGYCTEAARTVVRYGFEQLGLNRIQASHFEQNPASGRVLQKIGMAHEGRSRQHVKKWDRFEDLVRYAVLRSEWEQQRRCS